MRGLLDQTKICSARHALAYVTLALGTHTLVSENASDMPVDGTYVPLLHFNIALKYKPQYHVEKFNIQDFQVSRLQMEP